MQLILFLFKIRSYEHQILFLLPSRPLFFLVRGGTCPHCPYRLIAYDLRSYRVDNYCPSVIGVSYWSPTQMLVSRFLWTVLYETLYKSNE